MLANQWESFILVKELPDNGVFLCTITDDVLDAEDWPIWAVCMRDGIITSHVAITDGVYAVGDMTGWNKYQLAEWVKFEPSASHPQEFHSIMRIS